MNVCSILAPSCLVVALMCAFWGLARLIDTPKKATARPFRLALWLIAAAALFTAAGTW